MERGNADGVDLVVDNVAGLLEVDGVDGLVVAVVLVAVRVFGLAAVSCGVRFVSARHPKIVRAVEKTETAYLSSARTANHWVEHH